jgi:glycosyltransferase involved in cell wall biosynthesis
LIFLGFSNLRILQVIPYFPPAYAFGGPVKVVYEISRELVKRGHQVTVYTSDAKNLRLRMDESSLAELDGIQTYYMKNLSMFTVRKTKMFITPEIISRIKKEGQSFDIIHLHEYRTFQNLIVSRYAKKHNIPYVLHAHGALPRISSKQWLKWLFDSLVGREIMENASKVIALNQIEAEQYMARSVPPEKIAIVPNGINLSEFNDLPVRGSFKNKFGVQDSKRIILYLGRVHKTKGIDFLIRAYACLNKTLKQHNTVLVICGPDDGYLSEAKRLARSLGISDLVIYTGLLSEEDKILAYVDSTICVYLNPLEPFGLVPLESAACGRPIIVSKNNYMDKIVSKGNFGFSVNYGDVGTFSEIVKRMLDDTYLLRKLGQNGRKFVFKNFNWNDKISELEKVYEMVVHSNAKKHQ